MLRDADGHDKILPYIQYETCDSTGCIYPFSSRIQVSYAHSTCCQCAPTNPAVYNWCNSTAPDFGTGFLPSAEYDQWQTQGCDGYRPDIYYDASAAQAYAPGGWFTVGTADV